VACQRVPSIAGVEASDLQVTLGAVTHFEVLERRWVAAHIEQCVDALYKLRDLVGVDERPLLSVLGPARPGRRGHARSRLWRKVVVLAEISYRTLIHDA